MLGATLLIGLTGEPSDSDSTIRNIFIIKQGEKCITETGNLSCGRKTKLFIETDGKIILVVSYCFIASFMCK